MVLILTTAEGSCLTKYNIRFTITFQNIVSPFLLALMDKPSTASTAYKMVLILTAAEGSCLTQYNIGFTITFQNIVSPFLPALVKRSVPTVDGKASLENRPSTQTHVLLTAVILDSLWFGFHSIDYASRKIKNKSSIVSEPLSSLVRVILSN